MTVSKKGSRRAGRVSIPSVSLRLFSYLLVFCEWVNNRGLFNAGVAWGKWGGSVGWPRIHGRHRARWLDDLQQWQNGKEGKTSFFLPHSIHYERIHAIIEFWFSIAPCLEAFWMKPLISGCCAPFERSDTLGESSASFFLPNLWKRRDVCRGLHFPPIS